MKAKITSVEFAREYTGKYGQMFVHEIGYDGKSAYYTSKSKDQKKFIEGQEAEFTEESRTDNFNNQYLMIKPIRQDQGNYRASPAGRQMNREQARYSGFAVSYVKDLIVAGIIPIKDWESASTKIHNHMVELDKKII